MMNNLKLVLEIISSNQVLHNKHNIAFVIIIKNRLYNRQFKFESLTHNFIYVMI